MPISKPLKKYLFGYIDILALLCYDNSILYPNGYNIENKITGFTKQFFIKKEERT